MIKVDKLAAGITLRVVGAGLVNLHNPPANEKQGPIPEEISQTLLTNKEQGNLD